jgi:hypothetical protein
MGAFDPDEYGIVPGLNRPGGNITGVTSMNTDLGPRRLGLLHELLPRAVRFAVLVNPNQPAAKIIATQMRAAAATVGGEFPAGTGGNRAVGRLPLDECRRAKFQPPRNPWIAA